MKIRQPIKMKRRRFQGEVGNINSRSSRKHHRTSEKGK